MTATSFQVGLSIFRGTLGVGILALPYCLWSAGIIPALFLFTIICALTTNSMVILVRSALLVRGSFQPHDGGQGKGKVDDDDDDEIVSIVSSSNGGGGNHGTFKHDEGATGSDFLHPPSRHHHHHRRSNNNSFSGDSDTSSVYKHIQPPPPERRYTYDDIDSEDSDVTADHTIVTYPMLCTAAFGEKYGGLASCAALLPTQWIVCVTFLVLVLTNSTDDVFYGSIELAIVVLAVLECILVIPRSTSYLAFTSLFGNIAFTIAVSCVLYYAFGVIDQTRNFQEGSYYATFTRRIPLVGTPSGIGQAVGIVVFGFGAYAEVLGVLSSANDSARRNMTKIVVCVQMFVLVLSFSFSTIVVAAFGNDTAELTLDNLPHTKNSMILFLVRTSMSFVMVCTFPLVIFPVFHVVETTLLDPQHTATRLASRWLIVWSTAFVAYLFGNRFGPATAIGGGLACVLGYVLPPMFDLVLCADRVGLHRRVLNYCVVVFGCVASAASIGSGIHTIVSSM
eukprot:PhM_4_TR11342/c0_g1_i3/m.55663/K14209/SLC36A, PAT; solute carrier family 36 (proton-coupled amino acid transporter)